MCWMCDRKYYSDQLAMGPSALDVHVRGVDKFMTAFPVDGMGDLKPPVGPTGLIVTPDEAGGGKDVAPGNPVLTVGAPHTIATINEIGDEDFFQVTLTAGTTYEIGQYAYTGGPNGVFLTDPYIELYRADGTTMVTSADGGANTPYNDANSGFDVLLTWTADVSGTYYVNARAFSNSPATDNGDSVGDYELFVQVQDPNDPNVYHPYYDVDEPLYAIDWGTQVNKVHQSVRNPDGDEGTRNTGNDTAELPNEGGPGVAPGDALGHPGKNIISIYFAKPGDVFVSNDPTNPGLPPATITAVAIQDFEYTAVWTSLAEFAKVADIVYIEVQDQNDADFIYTSYQGTPGPGVSLLGSMSPPDESDEGLAQFNSGDSRWNARDLAQGGFSFVTLIHEFGHGHGLAHPHDNGGHSGIMRGVEEESAFNYTTGDYELNQGVFTMMSYEDGWQSSPYGNAPTNAGYGYMGGLSPFDVAAIQDKYGVNESHNTGNNIYTMKDVNAAGTFYYAIWDGGGTDEIVYNGSRNANIDLRAASLQYEWGGGGWVSYAFGIYGGFTIANGVTIENARGGSGNDTLIGNDVANILVGGAGADAMSGGGGNDLYYADNSGDSATENADEGTDHVLSSASFTLGENVETLTLTGTGHINGTGSSGANTIIGNPGNNRLDGAGGADVMKGRDGNDTYIVDNVGDRIEEAAGQGTDQVLASASHVLSNAVENLTLTGSADIDGTGNGSANLIIGNAGNNVLNGMGGADLMKGREGNDTYHVDNVGDVADEAFGQGTDGVFASVSFTLDGDIENLTLTGSSATNGTGTVYANVLTGNSAANILSGLGSNDTIDGGGGNDSLYGGTGQDSLTGGAGSDGFYFDSSLSSANADQIHGYSSAQDTIYLDDAVFTALGLGTLGANAFVLGAAAGDADDRIVYNQATGQIFYDRDGVGGSAAVQFASVDAGTILTNADFIAY